MSIVYTGISKNSIKKLNIFTNYSYKRLYEAELGRIEDYLM